MKAVEALNNKPAYRDKPTGEPSAFSLYRRAVSAELQKLSHSSMFFAVVALPVIGVLLGTGNYIGNAGALHGSAWFDLWTQIALFYGYFFYPILMAVIAGYLWRVEHFEHNWNGLMTTPVPPAAIWLSKLTVLFMLAVLVQCLTVGLYAMAGLLLKLPGTIPSFFWWWLVGGPIGVMASAAVQLYLSMRIRSFSIPVGISLGMSLMGLACYAKGLWFFPNTLAIIGVNAQHEELPALADMLRVFGASALWVLLASAAGIWYLKHKDVKTEN